PPQSPAPQPLRVRLRGPQGEAMMLRHRYRLRLAGQGVVASIPGTGTTRLFAVAVAPDDTVWAGGDGGGTLYRVSPRASTAASVGQLLAEPAGRVEDLAVDQLGRLHAIVFASQTAGDIVIDQGRFCQTVNVFDPVYPFHVRDVQTGLVQPSASTRALAA